MPAIWQPAFYKPQIGEIVDWDTWAMPRPLGDWQFNEGSGDVINDDTGNNLCARPVSIDSSTAWRPTETGKGFYIPGNDALPYVGIVDSPVQNRFLLPWTMSVLATFIAHGDWGGIFHRDLTGTSNAYGIQWYKLTWQLALDASNGSWSNLESIGSITPGVSTHITMTWVAGKGTIYIDGRFDNTGNVTGSGDTTGATTMFGRTRVDGGGTTAIYEQGCLWDVALSASQVQALQGPVPIWSPRRYWWVTAGGAVSAGYYQSLLRANRQGRAA